MKTTKPMVVIAAAVAALGLHDPAKASAQAPAPPTISGTVSFEVAEGNCTPQAATTHAGVNIVALKLSSSRSQSVMLVTPGTKPKIFLEHTQSGTSEEWSTTVMLSTGSYELVSSISGQKCSLTVN
jgi:hypothetical protein